MRQLYKCAVNGPVKKGKIPTNDMALASCDLKRDGNGDKQTTYRQVETATAVMISSNKIAD